MNVEQAVTFVESSGKPAQIALAHYAVERISAEEALQAIAPHQRADGSWSGTDEDMPGDISSISQTWVGLQWLIWLHPAGDDPLQRTVEFLKRVQHPESFWDEPDEITAFNPPPWMQPGNQDNQVWLTSAVCAKLKELGQQDQVNFEQALEFLRLSWRADERQFNDSTHPHWMALPLFHNSTHAGDNEIEAGCRDRLVEAVEHNRLDPYDYPAVAHAAILASDLDLFRRCMDKLEGFQQPDGGLMTHYGDQHRANGTVELLFLLKRAHMLPALPSA